MAPMRPVWMLHDSVMADRIGPDQYEVCELIGIGRMCRLWLPRQSPATIGHEAHGDVISPGAGQSPWAKASSKIGRASCRERVEISVVAGSLKKKEVAVALSTK